MDSGDRVLATFWASAAAVLIAIVLALYLSAADDRQRNFDMQMYCMKHNASWSERVVNNGMARSYTCTFSR